MKIVFVWFRSPPVVFAFPSLCFPLQETLLFRQQICRDQKAVWVKPKRESERKGSKPLRNELFYNLLHYYKRFCWTDLWACVEFLIEIRAKCRNFRLFATVTSSTGSATKFLQEIFPSLPFIILIKGLNVIMKYERQTTLLKRHECLWKSLENFSRTFHVFMISCSKLCWKLHGKQAHLKQ